MIQWLWRQAGAYNDWSKVLAHFDVDPIPPTPLETVLPQNLRRAFGQGGEGPAHKEFKQFVADHPHCVDVRGRITATQIEYYFASADKVDVLFTTRVERVAVEVKARDALETDILRAFSSA